VQVNRTARRDAGFRREIPWRVYGASCGSVERPLRILMHAPVTASVHAPVTAPVHLRVSCICSRRPEVKVPHVAQEWSADAGVVAALVARWRRVRATAAQPVVGDEPVASVHRNDVEASNARRATMSRRPRPTELRPLSQTGRRETTWHPRPRSRGSVSRARRATLRCHVRP
jgi:hypothetical protein